jgi:hypothetical protein
VHEKLVLECLLRHGEAQPVSDEDLVEVIALHALYVQSPSYYDPIPIHIPDMWSLHFAASGTATPNRPAALVGNLPPGLDVLRRCGRHVSPFKTRSTINAVLPP